MLTSALIVGVERKRKLPCDDADMTAVLERLGYRASEPVAETDTYYSRPDVSYLATIECLRVRQHEGFAEITYKPASGAATRSPQGLISKTETNVTFANIGMRALARVEKSYTTYRHPEHPDACVSIDTVRDAGTFIETEVTRADRASAGDLVDAIEKELGVADRPSVSLPYRNIVLATTTFWAPGASFGSA